MLGPNCQSGWRLGQPHRSPSLVQGHVLKVKFDLDKHPNELDSHCTHCLKAKFESMIFNPMLSPFFL